MLVQDLAVTVDFYRHVLGFELVAAPSDSCYDWALLQQGEAELLFQHADLFPGDLPAPLNLPGGLVSIRLHVPDVQSLFERVRDRADVVRSLTSCSPAEFCIRDCNGFLLTFTEAGRN